MIGKKERSNLTMLKVFKRYTLRKNVMSFRIVRISQMIFFFLVNIYVTCYPLTLRFWFILRKLGECGWVFKGFQVNSDELSAGHGRNLV